MTTDKDRNTEEVLIDGNRCLVEYDGDKIIVLKVLELNTISLDTFVGDLRKEVEG